MIELETPQIEPVEEAGTYAKYEVGPLVVRLTDPFGLCELTRSFPSVDRLTVILTDEIGVIVLDGIWA
jgi:hypothetical protein